MTDNLAELLYTAWRSSLLSSALTASDDLPSWGNVRDPDVRAAWEAAATKARVEVRRQCADRIAVGLSLADADGEISARLAIGWIRGQVDEWSARS